MGFIEGIRGLLALYVVFQHVCSMVDPHRRMLRPGAQPEWLAHAMQPMWYGHLAVSGFIVVSGFCLQMALYKRGDGRIRDLRSFLLRRCERILPPYYGCLAVSILVCLGVTRHQTGMPWEQYLPLTWENVAAHVAMVHNLRPDWMYKINGVLWSIAIEFQLYFLFPLFVWALLRFGKLALLAGLAGVAGWSMWAFPQAAKLYVWYAALFGLGMAAAHLAYHPRGWRPPAWVAGSVALLSSGVLVWALGQTKELVWLDTLGGVAIAALLAAGVLAPKAMLPRLLGAKPLFWLGSFSYSLYLMHHPVMQVVFVYRPDWASTPTRQTAYLLAVGLPVILAACYAFFWVFERPFLRSRRFRGV